VVWGEIAIGIEVREPLGAPPRRLALLIDDEPLTAEADTGDTLLPDHAARFTLDLSGRPAGPLALIPVAIDEAGVETRGPAVSVTVVAPSPADVIGGEAEATYEFERPARFANDRVNIGNDPAASGGKFFANYSADPAFCFPLEVETPGWYQVMLVAGGVRAAGALPTVGIVVDGAAQSSTNVRLIADGIWHRVAAGVPVRLDAGSRVITPLFANDFFAPGAGDRNLVIDRIEVLRVADASVGADADAGAMMMMAAMTPTTGWAAATTPTDDPFGYGEPPLRIGFTRVLDGLTLPGLTEIEGRAWWRDANATPAPEVTLLVNDRPVARQRSGAPRFWVDPNHFAAGANTIRLVARLGDLEATTPVQRVDYPAAAAADRGDPRHHRRFSIHEPAWSDDVRAVLSAEHDPREGRAADLSRLEHATLTLPPELEGQHQIFAELRGEGVSRPRATFALRTPDGTVTEFGSVTAPGGWQLRAAGAVELPPGPKTLLVAATAGDEGRGQIRLESVIVAVSPRVADRVPPVVEIDYPPADHVVDEMDAIVARASDNASVLFAELLLDGASTGLRRNLNRHGGDIVLPILTRELAPGPHTVGLLVTDVSGNSTRSELRSIRVPATTPASPGRFARAVRVLDRFGFGPAPRDLAAILRVGENAWLADQLERGADHPAELAAIGATLPHATSRRPDQVIGRTLSHLLLTDAPARARFVLFVENHFSTWIRKTDGPRKWNEHIAMTRLGAAPFEDVLLASAESPAMLVYLDQERSFRELANENYAREVMELHTLGVDGGYDQRDVTELSRILTGWTASFEGDGRGGGLGAQRYHHRFDRRLNDEGSAQLFGLEMTVDETGAYDRARQALEMLVAHPSTSRFIAKKLAEHYVSVPAPPALVDELAAVFRRTGGDLRAMMLAILDHPSFWDEPGTERVASPLDYAVGLARVTGRFAPGEIQAFLGRSGYGLFDRVTPDGYPEDDRLYTSSNALLQRWRHAHDLRWELSALVPGTWHHDPALDDERWADRVVDVLAARTTGRPLTASSHAAAVDLLLGATGRRHERIASIASFLAQLPELNLR
ncbi:MAG: DUF1800 family protein, partial [Phycisphaerales bacterium]|nr:DUF1800 family protein [Phycisphaerales bacterium]